ncbi:AI-2E family transporter [Guyparkeria hydrothermalis]|uniref:AI-2E family transporter n=1 Tax=Guyparkeria hydrothermalis TaxID=923 RepID=UPI0020229585|nr:AI-2E family transporter [Guyparkeria hydrothermalis]MCL7751468.1 AI-2E family transporter [Guyparkeria hydrothermalis]
MRWMIGIGLAGLLLVSYFLLPILSPFVVGFIIAYLFNPVVTRLDRHGISRTWGTSLIFLVGALLLLVGLIALIPVLIEQTARLVRVFPQLLDIVQQRVIPWVNQTIGVELHVGQLRDLLVKHGETIGKMLADGLSNVSTTGTAVFVAVMNLLLIPVIAFYLLRDWPRVVERIEQMLPRHRAGTIVELARESDQMLGNFLRGQLAVMIANGVTYSIGLTLIGLNTGIAIGLFAGLVSFVPYLGTITGVALALIAMYIQADSIWPLLLVLGVFGVGQVLETVAWQPRFVGNEIGMHPVAVIFAVMAGGQLFGFFGILLALPVSAVLIVLGEHALIAYQQSRYYRGRDARALPPGDGSGDDPVADAGDEARD